MSDVQIETPGSTANVNTGVSLWSKADTNWMLSLFGTAIGAGVLFLPINAGANGLLPLILIAFLAYPMTFFSHRALSRFVLSTQQVNHDITAVAKEQFGLTAGWLVTFLYFFAIFPILLMYSVAITNTVESFINHQLQLIPPSRTVLSAIILFGLLLVISVGQGAIIKAMSALVYPFIASLLLLSLYLVPQWDLSHWAGNFFIKTPAFTTGAALLKCLWFLIPLIVFSFNHSPIISSFAQDQRQRYGADADGKINAILRRSHILMIVMVMFFVVSCVLSLTPTDLMMAREENISILSYLANHFHNPAIAYTVPLIAFAAIAKSFLGHYLGAREGLKGLLTRASPSTSSASFRVQGVDFAIMVLCWITASLNPSILGMIETLGGPIIAIILFIMPVYAVYTIPSLARFKRRFQDGFLLLIGLIAMSARIYYLLY